MKLVESLAKAAGAAIGSSRPVAETLKYLYFLNVRAAAFGDTLAARAV